MKKKNLPKGLYGLPAGMIRGEFAAHLVETGQGLPLAGQSSVFTGVQFLDQAAPNGGEYACVSDLLEGQEKDTLNLLARLSAARPLPGLSAAQVNRPRGGATRPLPVHVMGILNVTPDSFSDGGKHLAPQQAVQAARKMRAQGATMIDVGGESTRPGAKPVSADEEAERIFPVLEALHAEGIPFSVDTRKAVIMKGAIERGAGWINDVSALTYDPDSLPIMASCDVPVILMHSVGGGGETTRKMSDNSLDRNAVLDVYDSLASRIAACEDAGISRNRLIVDPGIGFGKTLAGNLELIRHIALFHGLGVPVLAGVSRKRFIGELTGVKCPEARDSGSVGAAMWLAGQGIQLIRVHSVAKTKQAMDIYFA